MEKVIQITPKKRKFSEFKKDIESLPEKPFLSR